MALYKSLLREPGPETWFDLSETPRPACGGELGQVGGPCSLSHSSSPFLVGVWVRKPQRWPVVLLPLPSPFLIQEEGAGGMSPHEGVIPVTKIAVPE